MKLLEDKCANDSGSLFGSLPIDRSPSGVLHKSHSGFIFLLRLLFWNGPSAITVKVAVLRMSAEVFQATLSPWLGSGHRSTLFCFVNMPCKLVLLCPFTAANNIPLPSLAFRLTLWNQLSNQLSLCPEPLSQAPDVFLLIKAQAIEHMDQSSIMCLKAHEHLYWKTTGALDISLFSSVLRKPQ